MSDPFGDDDMRVDQVEEDDFDRREHECRTGDSSFEDPRNPFVSGCLFPGECCMPCDHFTSECFTAEMMEDLQREQDKKS